MKLQITPIMNHTGAVISKESHGDLLQLDPNDIKEIAKSEGAILFSGFDVSIEDFEAFTNPFCSDYMTYTGGAHERQVLNPNGDGTIYSVNFYLGRKQQLMFTLPLHADMSYISKSPQILWFYTVHMAKTGGETMLCDGAAVYDELRDSTKQLFHDKKISYIRKYPDGNWQGRFDTDNLDDVRAFCKENDLELSVNEDTMELTTSYTVTAVPHGRWLDRPVFRNSILTVLKGEEKIGDASIVRLEDGEKIPDDVQKELWEVTDRLTILPKMRNKEFMLVDNSRFLHGRREFDDPDRQVAIRMGRELDW